jgi:hypothetical protein
MNEAATEKGWLAPPKPLRGAEGKGWTRHSIAQRLPETGRRVLAEDEFPDEVAAAIEGLIEEIPHAPIQEFDDPFGPDTAAWQRYVKTQAGATWLEAPWFFVETYFYRRLVAISGYFAAGTESWRDPFLFQKTAGLEAITGDADLAPMPGSVKEAWLAALWGNQADLSLWPRAGAATKRQTPSPARDRILVDQRSQVDRYLAARSGQLRRIDLILDNAGHELLADLRLISLLMSNYDTASIHLHLKAHPTFVSDATAADVLTCLDRMLQVGSTSNRQLATRLLEAMVKGALSLHTDLYWTSPLAGWEMPAALTDELASSDLLIFKGDANYRRLLGDRHWPLTTPVSHVLGYLPAAALLIRTLKSEVAIGLNQAEIKRAQQADENWMINGNWGLIQFFQPDD